MRKLTITELTAILQLDENISQELVKNFDSYGDDLKYEILEILWDGLYDLKKELAQVKYQELLMEVKNGNKKLTTDLYEQAEESVWRDFEEILAGKLTDIRQLEEIRAKLQPQVRDQLSQKFPVKQ